MVFPMKRQKIPLLVWQWLAGSSTTFNITRSYTMLWYIHIYIHICIQFANSKLKASRTENKNHLPESRRDSEQKMERMQAAVLSKIEKELKAISGKLQEIHDSVSKRIIGVEERVSLRKNHWHESELFGKDHWQESVQFEKGCWRKTRDDGEKDQRHRFETIASRNRWGDDEKALELILALKGVAVDKLKTMPIVGTLIGIFTTGFSVWACTHSRAVE